jgi:asparagine synthase (glutamine-hydrolysing)
VCGNVHRAPNGLSGKRCVVSAFAGCWRRNNAPVDRRDMERLAQALPQFDGARATIWVGGSVAFVHRLYVVTPEDRLERQPWTSRSGMHRLVFAGYLDNRADVAAALGLTASELRETADGALCLAAIERWGERVPEHLFGAFAFACWNERDRRLLLCRDPMGARALYIHRGADLIAFATTMDALHALPDVPRALDETVVGDLLSNNPFETRRTPYRGIERIQPGEIEIVDSAGTTRRRYWQPRRRSLGLRTHDDYVAAAREQLDRAVGRALRSAGTVASETSGGLDSSGVAATAARLTAPNRFAVYTRVPPPAFNWAETERVYFDERPKVAALVRSHSNMDVTFVDNADPHDWDWDASRFFAKFGFPVLGVNNLGWFAQLYDRVKADGHRVLLTGGSGNFSLGWGGDHLLHRLVAKGRWVRAAQEAMAVHNVSGQPLSQVLRQFIVSPLVPRMLRRIKRRWRGIGVGLEHNTFIAPAFARDLRLTERIEKLGGWNEDLLWGDPFEMRAHWLINSGEFARDIKSQMLAVHGFEVRNPLGDPHLIEFSLNVPEEHYLRGGRRRALQRDTIADRVPPEIYENQKFGEQAPEWSDRMTVRREAILADIEKIARSPLASRAIDIDSLRKAAQNWPADAQAARHASPKFRYGVGRAVHLGNFVRWFEGGNR